MLAERLPGILPPLEPQELLEVAMVQSIAGTIVNGTLTPERPFRAPHHSASMAALVGGGARPKPGEVARWLIMVFCSWISSQSSHLMSWMR